MDALLAAMMQDAKTCQYAGCKERVGINAAEASLGQICRFCRKKFCYKHGIPEVHESN